MARLKQATMASESDQVWPWYSVWNLTPVLKSLKAVLTVVVTIVKSMACSRSLSRPKGRLNCGTGSSS